LPFDFFNLTNLKHIFFYDNQITNIHQNITQLHRLEYLDLNYNKLQSIPNEISELKNLFALRLAGNKITKLPPELLSLKKLQILEITNNPLRIPPEIGIKRAEPQVILKFYFETITKTRKSLDELKLLMVGQGSVGKTSIIKRILQDGFNTQETKTEGISINH
jgi:internalin A